MSGQHTKGVRIFPYESTATGPIFPYKETKFFQDAISKFHGVAPTPGTADAAAISQYGAINVPYNATLLYVHLHQTLDGTSGTNTVELYRRRSGAMTKIASVSLTMGGGDFVQSSFTITDAVLLKYDYIYMQATSVATGGTPVGTVDCHLEYTGE